MNVHSFGYSLVGTWYYDEGTSLPPFLSLSQVYMQHEKINTYRRNVDVYL